MDQDLPNLAFFDILVDNANVPTLIRLYRTNRGWNRAINDNLKKISDALGIPPMKRFQDLVEAYEKTILELSFSEALPRAAQYSVKLFQRVLYENPMPFIPDAGKATPSNLKKIDVFAVLRPDKYDGGTYHLPCDNDVARTPYLYINITPLPGGMIGEYCFADEYNYWTVPGRTYDILGEQDAFEKRDVNAEEKTYIKNYHDALVSALENKNLPSEVKRYLTPVRTYGRKN